MHHGFDSEAFRQIAAVILHIGKGCRICRTQEQTDGIKQSSLADVAAAQNDIHPWLGMPFELLNASERLDGKTMNGGCVHAWVGETDGYLSRDLYLALSRRTDWKTNDTANILPPEPGLSRRADAEAAFRPIEVSLRQFVASRPSIGDSPGSGRGGIVPSRYAVNRQASVARTGSRSKAALVAMQR